MINRIFKTLTFKGKLMLIIAVIFFTLYALAGTGIMLVTLDMLEKITSKQSITLVNYWYILIGLLLFKTLCNLIADISKHFAGFEIVERIRQTIIFRLKQFPLNFYTKERLGEISTIIHKDVDNMEAVVAHMWSRMSSDFLVTLILGIGLFIVDWRLGLAMISLLPVALLVLFLGIKSGKALQKETQDNSANMVSLFVEYVKGIPMLKAFEESSSFQERLNMSIQQFSKSSKTYAKSVARYLGKYSAFLQLCYAILSTLGAYFVMKNELSIYQYLIFIIISKEFYKPFAGMEEHWTNYIKVSDSYNRILTVLDTPIIESPLVPQKPNNFNITFNNIFFHYEKDGFQLEDINFTSSQNTLTALVGTSGSGKTTITNLLLRFWEPQGGIISIGGINIREIDYDDLLDNISIVMQNVILFCDTIYNNIKIGKQNATKDEVILAAKKAMIHDFIMGLPDGYDTYVGENGVGLSGGQKQRISIARALLKDSPIVILDEITSNVDPINESKIQMAITNLAANRTLIVIAHNLNTICTADQILVFGDGKIIQNGTHDELISKQGLYQDLWDSQKKVKQWTL